MEQAAGDRIELTELGQGGSPDQPKLKNASLADIHATPHHCLVPNNHVPAAEPSRDAIKSPESTKLKSVQFAILAKSCLGIFIAGLNDTATGANLPSMQSHYSLSYAVVSLVFLAGLGGYLVSSILNSFLQTAIGTRWVLLLAGCLHASGSLLIVFSPPFPLVTIGLALMGLGSGFYETSLTSVVSHFESSELMNMLYAFSSLGSLISPFIIGALVKRRIAWNLYYWIPFSLAALTTLYHFSLFKEYVAPSNDEVRPDRLRVRARYIQGARMRITWIGVVLLVLGCTMIDTQSNWLTSYLIDVKGSKPDVSRYQLSVFWLGLTLGRIFFSFSLVHVSDRIGNNMLLVALIGTLVILYKVESAATNWITAAFAGFFAGPNTPGILSIVSTRVPPDLKAMVLSITIGISLLGSTLGPLLFGLSIDKILRLADLPLAIIVLAGLSALIFWIVPPSEKKNQQISREISVDGG